MSSSSSSRESAAGGARRRRKAGKATRGIGTLIPLKIYNVRVNSLKKLTRKRPMDAARAGTSSRDATRAPSSDAR
jgi:hypothetical protein